MNAGSLFSGIGGFDLALQRNGIPVLWQVEIDKNCQDILKRHFTETELYSDVKSVGRNNLESVDIICGGFPCQDLSIAGRREGLAGERSGLWFEFARIIEELKPGWVVIENVPGLLSSNGGRDFAVIVNQMVKLGYGVAWRVLDAQYFGLAQRRKRVFIVGSFGSGRAAEVLFEREGGCWNPPPSREKGERVAGSLDKKSASSNRGSQGNELDFLACGINQSGLRGRQPGSAATMIYGGNNTSGEIDVSAAVNAHPSRRMDFESETFIATFDPINVTSKANRTRVEPGNPSNTLHSGGMSLVAWHNRQQSGEIRMQNDTVNSMTKSWGTGGNNVPFVGVRRLTPTECERLQGFPDGWTDGQSDSARYRQLGNAVAVPVAEWIIERIVNS